MSLTAPLHSSNPLGYSERQETRAETDDDNGEKIV